MYHQTLRTFFMYLSLFLVGGFIYGIIEVTYRGYTHPSMFIPVSYTHLDVYKRQDTPSAQRRSA